MNAFADGEYDVIVIEAREDGDDVVHLEVAVSSGTHRGEVVVLKARHFALSLIDVLGRPGTLVVSNGEPRLRV